MGTTYLAGLATAHPARGTDILLVCMTNICAPGATDTGVEGPEDVLQLGAPSRKQEALDWPQSLPGLGRSTFPMLRFAYIQPSIAGLLALPDELSAWRGRSLAASTQDSRLGADQHMQAFMEHAIVKVNSKLVPEFI